MRQGRLVTFVVALVALVVLVAVSESAAQTGSDTDNPAPHTNILGLVSQTPAVEPGGDFTMRLRVTGAPADAKVQAQVHDRATFRSDFQRSINGHNLHTAIGSAVVEDATPNPFTGNVDLTIPTRDATGTVPGGSTGGVSLRDGVYPVSVSVIDSSKAVLDSLTTFLVRLPVPTTRDYGPLGVAVVLPIGGGLSLQPDGSKNVDPAVQGTMVEVASALKKHPDVPATLAIDPESIDAVDPSTRAQLTSAATGRQTPVAPFVPVDTAAFLDAGLSNELGREFDVGAAHIQTIGSADATTYISDGSLSADGARYLRARGVRNIVVPEAGVKPLDERVFNRALTQPFLLDGVEGVTAMAADAGLAGHLTETDDPVLGANHLIADLAMIWYDDPPDARSMVVDLRNGALDPRFLDTLLAALEPGQVRVLTPQTVSAAFAAVPLINSNGQIGGRGTPLVRTLTPAPSANLSSYAPKLRAATGDVASYRTAVTSTNPRPDQFERQVLASGAKNLSDRDRTRYLDSARSAVKGELDKIEAPPRQTINFTARDGVVSLTMRNTTGYPVNVVLVLKADKLEFPGHDDGVVPVALTDDPTTTRVSLNVKTRASGDSALDVAVMTPDQNVGVDSTTVTVRSTAFSGVGLILSIGALLFLLIWWTRHTVKARRASRRSPRHAVGMNGAGQTPGAPAEPEPESERDPAPA